MLEIETARAFIRAAAQEPFRLTPSGEAEWLAIFGGTMKTTKETIERLTRIICRWHDGVSPSGGDHQIVYGALGDLLADGEQLAVIEQRVERLKANRQFAGDNIAPGIDYALAILEGRDDAGEGVRDA